VVEEIAARLGVPDLKKKDKVKAFLAEARYNEHKLILAQPNTFMNNSGIAASLILNWYKIPIEKMVLIYDDADLEVGQVRVRPKGSAAGHHGVESVIEHMTSNHFTRIRVGIGRENPAGDVSEYVLQRIPAEQSENLALAVQKAAEAALFVIDSGVEPAMNKYNA
jgi:PTH1 family peptidyl-tRNA hydrolase